MDCSQKLVLSNYRTQWQVGKHTYNILMLGIAEYGLAIPIVGQMLSKKGNSQTAEGLDVIEKFAPLFSYQRVGYLTADREFVGKQWFKYLSANWGFSIRIFHTGLIGGGDQYLAFSWFLAVSPLVKLEICLNVVVFGECVCMYQL